MHDRASGTVRTVGQRPFTAQLALYGLTGLTAWIGLVGIPGAGHSHYTGSWYAIAVLALGLLLGFLDPRTGDFRAGAIFVLSALLLAGWTTPRGDNDGLWLLVFPMLVVLGLLFAGSHWVGSRINTIARSTRIS
jgi:hypothetical protein